MATPQFWHRLIRFRHVISGSLALASLNLACRNPVPTFPQRSPPSLLTTAARGGSRSTPDADLEGSYSSATPCGPALLVTPCHNRTHVPQQEDGVIQAPCRRWRAGRRHGEAERFRGLEIDHQLKSGQATAAPPRSDMISRRHLSKKILLIRPPALPGDI
jgi:hypothetical protein